MSSCTPRPTPDPPATGHDGFVDADQWRQRQLDYLEHTTGALHPVVPESLLAHLLRADADPSFEFDPTSVHVSDWQETFDKLDSHRDTSDFDLMRLWVIWHGYRNQLDPALADAMQQRLLEFRYWYTDPAPAAAQDHKWFWSENHQIIIHAMEYLAGRDLTGQTFAVTGWTGSRHAQRGEQFVTAWLDEKARWGFSEWHSDVYYPEDIQALLLLTTYAEQPIADRAASLLDVMFLDLALHQIRGNMGVTHGRTYMKDKSRATSQNVYDIIEFLYGTSGSGHNPWADFGTLLLAGGDRYRLPLVLDRIAKSTDPYTDIERMNVPFDPAAPVTDSPTAPPGVDFTSLESVPFWWERGAMAAWQVAPLTLRAVREYDLSGTDLFAPYGQITSLPASDAATRHLARALQCQLNPGLLTQVDTVTYRSRSGMLSSAQDYRAGCLAYQVHAWQATLDENAVVFTTHPQNTDRGLWADDDRYWNGSATLPRVAQSEGTLIAAYSPGYDGGADHENYLPMTHAFFPTQHFDEVIERDGWVVGRVGDAYVALWSWRPTRWAPVAENPAGLTEPYDLIADGGADNVWITQLGDRATDGDLDTFVDQLAAVPPQVTSTDGSPGPELEVTWETPGQGELRWGTQGPFTIAGEPRELPGVRMTNPFVTVDAGTDRWHISANGAELELDLTTGQRHAG